MSNSTVRLASHFYMCWDLPWPVLLEHHRPSLLPVPVVMRDMQLPAVVFDLRAGVVQVCRCMCVKLSDFSCDHLCKSEQGVWD